jgi:hypothetical protein
MDQKFDENGRRVIPGEFPQIMNSMNKFRRQHYLQNNIKYWQNRTPSMIGTLSRTNEITDQMMENLQNF